MENDTLQQETVTKGTITELNIADGTITLDSGKRFTLPASFQFTTFPALGQEVKVSYVEEGGSETIQSIETGGEAGVD